MSVSSVAYSGSDGDPFIEFRVELDLNTNTPVVDHGLYILSHNSKTADISAYNPKYESI